MGTDLFAEIARTNGAWCESHGLPNAYLSDEEANGPPPNAAELETSRLIAHGVPAEAAVPRIVEKYRTGFAGDIVAIRRRHLEIERDCRLRRLAYRSHYPDLPFERLAKIERRLNPHAVVEYAMPERVVDEAMARFAGALGAYYAECRKRTGITFVGD